MDDTNTKPHPLPTGTPLWLKRNGKRFRAVVHDETTSDGRESCFLLELTQELAAELSRHEWECLNTIAESGARDRGEAFPGPERIAYAFFNAMDEEDEFGEIAKLVPLFDARWSIDTYGEFTIEKRELVKSEDGERITEVRTGRTWHCGD